MCKYFGELLIKNVESVYLRDLVSNYWMPPEPSGRFFYFHLDKPHFLYFMNLGVKCYVLSKPLWRVSPEGFQVYPFQLECRDVLLRISPHSLQTLRLNASLVSPLLGVLHGDSMVVSRFKDWNVGYEVDAMEWTLLKVFVASQMKEKLKSLKCVDSTVFDYMVHVKALRSFLSSSCRLCDLVKYVAITKHVMEVSSCLLYK